MKMTYLCTFLFRYDFLGVVSGGNFLCGLVPGMPWGADLGVSVGVKVCENLLSLALSAAAASSLSCIN